MGLRRGRTIVGARVALLATLVPVALATSPQALAAKDSLRVKDAAKMSLVKGASTAGSLHEQGNATGTMSGTIHATISLYAVTAKANFTIYVKGGTLTGSGTGRLKYGKGGYDSFGGAAHITGGTGRFAKATASGHIYGSIDRINYHVNVQLDGTLHY